MKYMVELDGLHEAMALAMIRREVFKMTAEELAEAIKQDQLWRGRDGLPPPPGRVIQRAQLFKWMFTVKGSGVSREITLQPKIRGNL